MSTAPTPPRAAAEGEPMSNLTARLVAAWAVVGIPLAYGVYETVKKAAALFAG